MSVEIILRDDITDFEPKPMGGFSYRQIATLAIIVIAAWFTQRAFWSFLDYKFIGCIIVLEAVVIGIIGFGKFKGLRTEQYLSAAIQDFLVPARIEYRSPFVESATDKALVRQQSELSRKERRCARKEKESDDIDG